MTLKRIIYTSQPFGFDDTMLRNVLMDARRCNDRDDVTGALLCRRDVFLQYLEGPASAVDAAFDRIKRDDRHVEVILRVSEPVAARQFGDWAMLHDPARSWFWSAEEVDAGALDRATPDDYRAVFADLAAQVTAPPAS